MLGMFGIRIMSENQLLNGYANGITPNDSIAVAMEMLPKECQNHQEITWAMYCLGTSVTLGPDEQVALLSESEFFNIKIERK